MQLFLLDYGLVFPIDNFSSHEKKKLLKKKNLLNYEFLKIYRKYFLFVSSHKTAEHFLFWITYFFGILSPINIAVQVPGFLPHSKWFSKLLCEISLWKLRWPGASRRLEVVFQIWGWKAMHEILRNVHFWLSYEEIWQCRKLEKTPLDID